MQHLSKLPLPLCEPGPLTGYLNLLTEQNPTLAADVSREIRASLKTPGGVKLMELLEICLMRNPIPISADPSALAARNAQGFILADLRRIASNELDVRLDAKTGKAGRG